MGKYFDSINDNVVSWSNVTFWNGTQFVNSDDEGVNVISNGVNQTIIVDLKNKVTDVPIGDAIIKSTDENSQITVDGFNGGILYNVNSRHDVGSTRSVSINFDASFGNK